MNSEKSEKMAIYWENKNINSDIEHQRNMILFWESRKNELKNSRLHDQYKAELSHYYNLMLFKAKTKINQLKQKERICN